MRELNYKHSYRYILLFQLLSLFVLFSFSEGKALSKLFFIPLVILVVGIVNYFLNIRLIGSSRHYAIVSMIFSIGVVEIFRLNPEYGLKQMFWFVVGTMLMYATYIIIKNFDFYKKLYVYYVAGIFLLFFITLFFGEASGGAKNWVRIFGHLFQPIELIKILYIMQLATSPKGKFYIIDYRLINIILTFLYMGLLMIQRDLGSALMIFLILLAYLLIFEKKKRYFIITFTAFIIFAGLGIYLLSHVRTRFEIWLHPFDNYNSKGYQIVTALTAMSNGGFVGTGIGQGIPNIIPVNISDMIIAAIVEEMGALMGIATIILYLVLGVDSLLRSKLIGDSNKRIMAVLIASFFIMQFFVILFGTMNIIPLTGITAPFLSYGGSSMLSSFIMLGMLESALRSSYE
ncbi:MAG: FtsW/RodA/SpoVE family cell cycle protein [Ezakiella sp.]|nr:FtsW/RodA/SpoVE family cell cycle protein [Ezakiella sp.]